MGAAQSAAPVDAGGAAGAGRAEARISARTADLDKYGGVARPPVKRGDSFVKTMDWLGESAAEQADQLQFALASDDCTDFVTPSQKSSKPSPLIHGAQPSPRSDGCESNGGQVPIWPQTPVDVTAKVVTRRKVPGYMASTVASTVDNVPSGQHKSSIRTNKGAAGNPLKGRKRGAKAAQNDKGAVAARRSTLVEARHEGWRERVQNAKKTAYLTLRVHLRLQKIRGNSLPEALQVDANGWIRGSLNVNFEKFVEHQRRFFRTPSCFDQRGPSLKRVTSIHVVDLDEEDGEYRDIGPDVAKEESSDEEVMKTSPEQKARGLMETLVRKANSHWVQRSHWQLPTVFDIQTHTLSAERAHYNHRAKVMLTKGRVGFHFLAAGEQMRTPDGRAVSCVTSDPWELMSSVCPAKIPCGIRVDGLPPVCRQIIQLVVSVQQLAGQEGVDELQVVLTVGGDEEDFVCSMLREHEFYGLEPSQISVLVQENGHGYKFDKKQNDIAESSESEPRLPGTGHALLQFGVVGAASTWQKKHLEPMNVSLLDHLRQKGVAWLMSVRMLDLHWCAEKGAVDLDFFGLALKLHDLHGANMVVEAAPCSSMLELRQNNSIIMTREGAKNRGSASCDVAVTDCLTMHLQEQIQQLIQAGSPLYTSQRRYMYYLPELQRQIMDRATFRGDLVLNAGYVYVDFDGADITSGPFAKCAAIVQRSGKPKAPPPTMYVQNSWLQDLAAVLGKQDNQDDFCQTALNCQSPITPITISRKPFIGERPLQLILFVCDNSASRKALRFTKVLMQQDANCLRIAHIVSNQQSIESAEQLLKFYRELLGIVPYNNLVTEVVMRRSGTTVETIAEYVSRQSADMVILGSEKLGSQHPMGSVSLSALKALKLPVLLVKADASGDVIKEEVDRKTRSDRRAIRCMLTVDNATRGVLKFATQMLNPMHDKLILARFRGHSQPGQLQDGNMDKRMMEHFQDVASGCHFKTQAMFVEGNPGTGITSLAIEHNCDVVAVRRQRGKLQPDVEDLIRRARTAILLHHDEDATGQAKGKSSELPSLSFGSPVSASSGSTRPPSLASTLASPTAFKTSHGS